MLGLGMCDPEFPCAAPTAGRESARTTGGPVAPNDFDRSASGQPDEAYLIPPANPFSSEHPHGTFPKLAPRKFPDDEDAAPEPVPPMEQLPGPGPGYPPPTYGPPPSYRADDFVPQR